MMFVFYNMVLWPLKALSQLFQTRKGNENYEEDQFCWVLYSNDGWFKIGKVFFEMSNDKNPLNLTDLINPINVTDLAQIN